ncbi:MAG: Hsp20 family protein [Deltaproteobacteria bacterium]|nr:Hsp20 family protein [Deltaproteobacteria bacterium]
MRDLVRWNPFHEFAHWHKDIDDFFGLPFRSEGEVDRLSRWWPALDGYEKDGQYVLRLDLPGMDAKEVEIEAEGNSLVIKGERKSEKQGEEKNYFYRETSTGRFERRIALPKGVDTSKIAARFDKGVLEISVPLPVHLAPKKVQIQIEDGKNGQNKAA